MMVGVLTVELAIADARSLKDKRRAIHGVKQRIRNRFNVSVAEVGFWDQPKRCRLGLAMVAKESRAMHSQFDKVVDLIRLSRDVLILEYHRETF